MTSDAFRKFWKAQPFEPFEVFLADGRSLKVAHPENIAISQSGRTASILDPEVDAFETVDLLIVTTLKPLNGHKRRKSSR
jgi:hypothetical protein